MGDDEDFTPNIAVDLDGVLAQYDEWEGYDEIGDPVPGAREFMHKLQNIGANVIVHTTRTNPDPFKKGVDRAPVNELGWIVEEWLRRHSIPFDSVFTGEGKPIASAYVDNRAVLCQPDRERVDVGLEFQAAFKHVESMLADGS